jgi:hypothetical protein
MNNGSRALSADDVRGARRYRHIPCYQAYYSTPRGEICTWNVAQASVQSAMATRVHLGNLSDTPRLPDLPRLAHVKSVCRSIPGAEPEHPGVRRHGGVTQDVTYVAKGMRRDRDPRTPARQVAASCPLTG